MKIMKGLRTVILLVFFFGLPVLCFVQDVSIEWIKTYTEGDEIVDLTVDSKGNIYVTGTTKTSPPDFVTLKYDADGKILWEKSAGDANREDKPAAMRVDDKGNVYVTGDSYGGASAYDFLTLKYKPNGKQAWSARLNNTENNSDFANDLAVDRKGNVYVTGGSRSSETGYNIVVVKYNSRGKTKWVSVFKGPGIIPPWNDDFGRYIQVDKKGFVYVAGTIERSYDDIFVMKLNKKGKMLWSQIYEGVSPGNDKPSGLALDSEGNIFVAGNSYSSDSSEDIVLLKYSNNGIREWVKRYTSPGNYPEDANDLVLDKNGNAYVTGSTNIHGNNNFITIKFAPDGEEEWNRQFDDAGYSDGAYAMAIDDIGDVYVTGNVQSKTISHDVFTLKYDQSGNLTWKVRYSGPTEYDRGRAVAVDSWGGVIVATDALRGDWTIIKYVQEP
ncbi:MAG: SBBP repeat-containing protein [Candidatus Aminicenantes bacterium]|nr:SBBP repeat-containing protein [Candidatus Aminicenantes bacterium]